MKILAGNWAENTPITVKKSFTGKWQELWFSSGLFRIEKMPLSDIVEFQIVTEENKASILGKVGWGAAGLLVLGPLGLLAGVLGGGNKRDRVMIIKTRDSRSAMIKGNSADAEAMMAATFGNKPGEMMTIEGKSQGRIEPTA